MNTSKKLEFLLKDLEDRISEIQKKRNRDRSKAYRLKLVAVFFGATITVMLGLQVDLPLADYFRNIALVFAAAITVVSAAEAFYDYRSLWIRRTVTLSRLYDLRRELKFYVSGKGDADIKEDILAGFLDRFNQIMQEYLKAWLRMREEITPPSEQAPTKRTR